MSMTLSCSSCQRELRLPEELIGKPVKCPACGQTFMADSTGPANIPPKRQENQLQSSQPPFTDHFSDEESEEGYEEGIDSSTRRSRRFYRAARDEIRGPAIGLMIVGMINCILGALRIVLYIAFMAFRDSPELKGRPEFNDMQPLMILAGAAGIAIAIAGIVVGVIITYGAAKMLKLKRYKLAMASSILALVPVVTFCCILGVPFGIWSIVVLCKPEVKNAFS
jgi:DNA-directed RNA polymerase subunit RPC12/RpoP